MENCLYWNSRTQWCIINLFLQQITSSILTLIWGFYRHNNIITLIILQKSLLRYCVGFGDCVGFVYCVGFIYCVGFVYCIGFVWIQVCFIRVFTLGAWVSRLAGAHGNIQDHHTFPTVVAVILRTLFIVKSGRNKHSFQLYLTIISVNYRWLQWVQNHS